MTGRIKQTAFLSADVINVILIILSAIFGVFSGDGALWRAGFGRFIYFTVDSNLLAALALAIAVPFKIRRMRKGIPLPTAVTVLCFTGASAVTVTFLTVVVFLGPLYGYGSMYAGNNLLLHMICPLLTVASFIFDCGGEKRLDPRLTPAGVLPTLIYGAVYFIMVIVIGQKNGGWADFYGFNIGGRWYISIVVMLAATYAASLLLWALQGAYLKRRS